MIGVSLSLPYLLISFFLLLSKYYFMYYWKFCLLTTNFWRLTGGEFKISKVNKCKIKQKKRIFFLLGYADRGPLLLGTLKSTFIHTSLLILPFPSEHFSSSRNLSPINKNTAHQSSFIHCTLIQDVNLCQNKFFSCS